MSDRLERIRQSIAPRPVETSIGEFLIKPVRLENLVMARRIPVTLVNKMAGIQRTNAGGFRMEDAVEIAEMIDAVVLAAVMDPPVTKDGGDDSLGLIDIPWEDRVLIFTEANRPAAALAGFPGTGEPGSGGDAAPDGEGVREAAE